MIGYKVVRTKPFKNSLTSYIACGSFQKMYRNEDGEILLVDETMIFDSRENAQIFFNKWDYGYGDLQLWECEYNEGEKIRSIVSDLWVVNPSDIDRDLYFYTDKNFKHSKHGWISLSPVPLGTLLAKNVKLTKYLQGS